MPELPEVETISLQLNQVLSGLTIIDIKVLSPKNFIGNEKDLIGKKILEVKRRAKVILIEFNNASYLLVHLKMTGQLIYQKKGEPKLYEKEGGRYDVSILPNKYTRVIISFNNQAHLYFNDLRKFGWMKIINIKYQISNIKNINKIPKKTNDKIDEIVGEKYGPEPFDNEFTTEYLKNIFMRTVKPVKLVLLDQEKIAGLGNIYVNEALFSAGILPTKKANQLTNNEIERLRQSIIQVLGEALKAKGTSDKDEAFRQITGEKGSFQNYLKVYGLANEKCLKCGSIIKKIKLGGRGTFYCPECQV